MPRLLSHPYLLLSLCALFWSGNFVLSRAMHSEIPPLALSFWRWTGALIVILPWIIAPLIREWRVIKAHFWRMTLLGLLGAASFNTFIYLGVQHTTATNSVLLQSSLPLVIVMLSWLIDRTRVTRGEVLSILTSLIGVSIIIGSGNPLALLQGSWNTGDLLVLCAVVVWALYSILLRWRPEGLDPLAFLGFSIIVAVLSLLPLYLWESAFDRSVRLDASTLMTISYVAVFPSVLAYLFWNKGVSEVGAIRAGYFVHLMPVFGTIMAVVFLGETFGIHHLIGAALIATAIVWATRAHRP